MIERIKGKTHQQSSAQALAPVKTESRIKKARGQKARQKTKPMNDSKGGQIAQITTKNKRSKRKAFGEFLKRLHAKFLDLLSSLFH